MAGRENQGLQIALILFVMITVVLAVTTYIYYRKAEEKIKEAASANDARKTAAAEADAHAKATELLKVALGASSKNAAEIDQIRAGLMGSTVAVKDDIKKIEDKFNADMQLFAADFAGEKNYTTLPDHLFQIINSKSVAIADGLAREATLRDESAKAVQGQAEKTKKAEEALQLAFADKDKVKADFDVERGRFTTETAALGTSVSEKAKELKEKTDTFTKEKTTLENQVVNLAKLNEGFTTKIKGMREETFEVPDGKITWVNQRTGTVTVDLGSADGLRRQTTFSVFSKDETNLNKGEAKGAIEVTRIVDAHLAECRIVSDNPADPLVPSDLVFSPVWHPGQTLRFALAGLIDYNGDGKSDRNLVTGLIQTNGGIIDAEVGDDGKMTGNMSVETRYLIVGKPPTETSTDEARRGFTKMQADADRLGVEKISVSKLLDFMGYKGEVSTVTLGKGASSSDFGAKNSDGVVKKSTGNVSGAFKPRSAPGRGKSGAY